MLSFESYMQECFDGGEESAIEGVPALPGALDLSVPSNRDTINFALLDLTETSLSPEVFYERTRGILSDVGYPLPSITSLTDVFTEESGEKILALGSAPLHYLYFAYLHDGELMESFAEVLTEDELDDVLSEDF